MSTGIAAASSMVGLSKQVDINSVFGVGEHCCWWCGNSKR
jgi:hypothetical protein